MLKAARATLSGRSGFVADAIFTIQLSIALGALLLGYVLEDFMAGAKRAAQIVAWVVSFSSVAMPFLLAPILAHRRLSSGPPSCGGGNAATAPGILSSE